MVQFFRKMEFVRRLFRLKNLPILLPKSRCLDVEGTPTWRPIIGDSVSRNGDILPT